MKPLTRLVHLFVKVLHFEWVFFYLNSIHPIFLKFLPLHTEYSSGTRRLARRSGATFDLNISDYMQWYVYAMQPDISWKKALGRVDNGTTILDIGANCGGFSLPLGSAIKKSAYHGVQVHAFEPHPSIFSNLKKNLSLNQEINQIVHVHQLGLGDSSGKFRMSTNASNSGHSRISDCPTSDSIEVEVNTIDNFVREHSLKNICFIKVDVEGFEPLVLKGSKEVIRNFKPDLYIEVTEKWFNEKSYSQVDLFRYLSNEGYLLFAERGGAFVKIDQLNQVYSENQYNLWATYER